MNMYQVDVTKAVSDKVAVVRALRTIGRLPLKQAGDIYDYMRDRKTTTVVAGVARNTADEIARTLNATGVNAIVRISSVNSPMLVEDAVQSLFSWSGIGKLSMKNVA